MELIANKLNKIRINKQQMIKLINKITMNKFKQKRINKKLKLYNKIAIKEINK